MSANIADTTVERISRFYRTPAFPAGSGPDFVNAAALLSTSLEPDRLLAELHGIEQDFGRVRRKRWAARTLDIDILGWGDAVLPDRETVMEWIELDPDKQAQRVPDRLIVPHPRIQDRGFVLVPLADVASDWRHPVLGRTVAEMLAALPQADLSGIDVIEGA